MADAAQGGCAFKVGVTMSDAGSKNIKFKAIITFIALPVVWLISKVIGFPILFRWLFAIYIVVMFLFFLLIDAPAMERRKKGALSIFVTFVIASVVYTFLGVILPQYNPKVEIEKSGNLQQPG